MNSDDDRDMYGNRRTGMFNSDEVSRAGGTPYDQPYQIEQKVLNQRKSDFDTQMNYLTSTPSWGSSSTPTPYCSSDSSSGSSGFSFRGLLAVLLVVVSLIGIAKYTQNKIDDLFGGNYASESSKMVFFDTYYFPPTGSKPSFEEFRSIFLEQFKQKYGALYRSGTPWETLYGDCTSKKFGCLGNPSIGFEKLRSYALKQDSLMEDICEINARYYHDTPISFLVKASWQIRFEDSKNAGRRPYCGLAKPDEYQEKVGTTIRMVSYAYVTLGIICALLSIILVRRLVLGTRKA